MTKRKRGKKNKMTTKYVIKTIGGISLIVFLLALFSTIYNFIVTNRTIILLISGGIVLVFVVFKLLSLNKIKKAFWNRFQ